MADRKLSITITGDAKSAKKALGDLDGALGKTEQKTKKSTSGIKSSLATLGIGAALFGAAKAFDESAKVAAQTEAVIKSTGNAANITAEGVANLAGELSKKSGIDDEAIQSGSNLIATFTNIRNEAGKGNDVFDQTTKAALDMSVAMGTDMTSSASVLGKALNNPITGLGKLQKANVDFTAAQKESIIAMAESGDTLGAQKAILEEVNRQFGGSAEAQATSMGKAQVAVDNLAESLGGAMAPAISTAADGLSVLADGLGALPDPLQKTLILGIGGATAWAKWGDGAKSAGKRAADFASNLGSLSRFAGPAGLAVAGVATAFLIFAQRSEAAKRKADQWNDDMEAMRDKALQTGEAVKDVFIEDFVTKWAGKNADALQDAGIGLEELRTKLSGSAEEWNKFTSKASLDADGGLNLAPWTFELEALREQMLETEGSTEDYKGAIKGLGGDAEGAAEGAEELAEAVSKVDEFMGGAKERTDAAAQSIRDYYDATTSGISNTIDFEASLDAFTEGVKENGTSLDVTTEKGRKNQENLIAMKDAAVQAAAGILEQTGSSDAAAFSLTGYANNLRQAARDAGYTEGEIDLMIRQMKLTPKDIETRVHAYTGVAEANIARVKAAMNGIYSKTVTIGVNVAMGSLTGGIGNILGNLQGRASGGPTEQGTTYLVGEEGPELWTSPFDGMMHDAGKTQRMLSGGGASSVAGMASGSYGGGGDTYIFHISGVIGDEQVVISRIAKGLRDAQARAGSRKILAGTA